MIFFLFLFFFTCDASPYLSAINPCVALEVLGAIDDGMNGIYWLDRGAHCEPTWVSARNGQYNLYYLESSFDGWVLSTHMCHNWGGFRALVQTPHRDFPYSIGNYTWKELNPNNNLIEINTKLQISCLEIFNYDYYKTCLFTRCLTTNEQCLYEFDDFVCKVSDDKLTNNDMMTTPYQAEVESHQIVAVIIAECLLLITLLAVIIICYYKIQKKKEMKKVGYSTLENKEHNETTHPFQFIVLYDTR